MLLPLLALLAAQVAPDLTPLPVLPDDAALPAGGDWLVDPVPEVARVLCNDAGTELILDNGLLRRTFRVAPNGATVALDDLSTGASLLRSVRPEARVVIDGRTFDVGGLAGQPNHAYLDPAWVEAMTADPEAMRLVGFEVGTPSERLAWKRVRHHAPDVAWPPKGVGLRLDFAMPEGVGEPLASVRVAVCYELYDGVPLYAKWIEVENGSDASVRVDDFTSEILAAVERDSFVETRTAPLPPPVAARRGRIRDGWA